MYSNLWLSAIFANAMKPPIRSQLGYYILCRFLSYPWQSAMDLVTHLSATARHYTANVVFVNRFTKWYITVLLIQPWQQWISIFHLPISLWRRSLANMACHTVGCQWLEWRMVKFYYQSPSSCNAEKRVKGLLWVLLPGKAAIWRILKSSFVGAVDSAELNQLWKGFLFQVQV